MPDRSGSRSENSNCLLTKYHYGEKAKSDGVDRYVARMVTINAHTVLINKPERKETYGDLGRTSGEGWVSCSAEGG